MDFENNLNRLSDLLDLRQAAELLPRRPSGRTIATMTLKKWMIDGLSGCKLGYLKVGCRYFTTAEQIRSFIQDLTLVDRQAKIAESWQTSSVTKQFNDSQQAVTLKRAAELGLIERKESF